MASIPYAHSNGHLSVEVKLKYAADVYLLDPYNYQKYTTGRPFEYYGGHYNRTPVVISVEGEGRWYLVVCGSDYEYRFF